MKATCSVLSISGLFELGTGGSVPMHVDGDGNDGTLMRGVGILAPGSSVRGVKVSLGSNTENYREAIFVA